MRRPPPLTYPHSVTPPPYPQKVDNLPFFFKVTLPLAITVTTLSHIRALGRPQVYLSHQCLYEHELEVNLDCVPGLFYKPETALEIEPDPEP